MTKMLDEKVPGAIAAQMGISAHTTISKLFATEIAERDGEEVIVALHINAQNGGEPIIANDKFEAKKALYALVDMVLGRYTVLTPSEHVCKFPANKARVKGVRMTREINAAHEAGWFEWDWSAGAWANKRAAHPAKASKHEWVTILLTGQHVKIVAGPQVRAITNKVLEILKGTREEALEMQRVTIVSASIRHETWDEAKQFAGEVDAMPKVKDPAGSEFRITPWTYRVITPKGYSFGFRFNGNDDELRFVAVANSKGYAFELTDEDEMDVE